ncbi:MAG: Gfo/Idh/MocA family oxidoreductase [Proteobacteria bacterium]|nr:Gfo/Idh/MocA family oxidoreductase [Pseudomonadota bacterium]MBU1583879.1 Gfo/Idh/MocA family oxidoreductase [Pseudomonadota bacterium]MBU2632067.1 Gfo/Idh/MocA family oxidoreductase [Pseudomonadota bacterium]
MRILVCGLGSMGKRRIGILNKKFPDFLICGVDPKKERREEVKKKTATTSKDFFEAFKSFGPDAVFVCSPPLTHADIVLFSLENNAHTFSEINLTSKGYDDIIRTAASFKKVAFLSSTFLYNREINWLIERTTRMNYLSYRYHTGQYLPDWHPWENYQDFFVFQKQTNALREIMAIEFPWLFKAFGPVVDYKCMTSNLSQLDLEYPDTIHLILKHKNGNKGTLSFDCVSRKAVRKLEVYNDTCFFEWNGTPGTLTQYFSDKKETRTVNLYEDIEKNPDYAGFIIENPYAKEVEAFIHQIENPDHSSIYGYDQDRMVIDLIDTIERQYEPI